MITENLEMCVGCGVCAIVCPAKCLTIVLNEDGFYIPKLETGNQCLKCNLCNNVCAQYIMADPVRPVKTLSVIAKNKNVLNTSSSGGLCYELARMALKNDKRVCAVIYDYNLNRAQHVEVKTLDELEETKGSKYFQSYTQEGFSEVLNGDEWVVFAAPCQVAAIDKAAKLKKVRDKLLLVDFFCHGTPSMNLWNRYLQANDVKKIKKIDFRSKEFGWGTFSFRFTYKDGSHKSDYKDNLFYSLFFSNLALNNACYDCHFKGLKSKSDIRVGDLWGTKYKDNRTGVSGCAVFSEKGLKVITELKDCCWLKFESEEVVLEGQMTKSPEKKNRERSKVLKDLRTGKKLWTIYNISLLEYRIKMKLRQLMRRKS